MCALRREQARREWESELQHVNSLQTIVEIGRKVGHELKNSYNARNQIALNATVSIMNYGAR